MVKTGDGVQPEPAMQVSANFLEALGVQPALGRNFRSVENVPGAEHVAILSYGLWQQNFGSRSSIVGQPVELDGQPYTVVGVLPKDFEFAPRGAAKILTPIRPETGTCEVRRSCHSLKWCRAIEERRHSRRSRCRRRIAAVLEQQYSASNRGQGAVAAPLTEQAVGRVRPILYTLFSGSILLFLMGFIYLTPTLLVGFEKEE